MLNYTHMLRKDAGSPASSVSATVNDPTNAVDSAMFTELTVRLIGLIERSVL